MSYTGFLDAIPNPQQPVGPAGNQVFYENDQAITADYTLSATKNAMTAGPITINGGVVVTVPSGSTWSII